MASVLVNGKNYDWDNLKFVMFGIPTVGITEINFSRTRERVNNYGIGGEPISYGYKNFMYKGDITLYKDEIKALELVAPNRSILEIPPFTISLLYSGDGVVFGTDTLNNVSFLEDNFVAKQNDSALLMKVPFVFAGLVKV